MKNNSNDSEKIVKDPVCGMTKPKNQMKTQLPYKGIVYYFCSDGDKDMFVAHPDHWIIKIK
ncbi:hypothetical protein A2767_07425 [Candidatus Roizmanbacteria bacterium RIFCSPHIGHO2_01_FULL_35_10]|uniref:YHS domain-containing protein n=1 Tax=Candidatus Roizmanbacteria bacterium RIFCSPLOWO2_01_FULL_35_13 TaxID=1802055 RepID=A0A1F7I6S6_9BACT|nr:MAG: hypothetical protein A2767_07425 [Candidatus Roizmanbacteria bacterium RIFCSPHIGHO2_01_FULL_35_10]OGK39043.1 MAG: hypothetical protein A3A74_08205 [Candidatus Roizmanbacteria bacterium RIFCSPLOWO2_01_FULL_35_13]